MVREERVEVSDGKHVIRSMTEANTNNYETSIAKTNQTKRKNTYTKRNSNETQH